MQAALIPNLVDSRRVNATRIENEIDKLLKFNHKFSLRLPRILATLGLSPYSVLRIFPLLHRLQLLKVELCVEWIIARGHQTPSNTDSMGRTVLHVLFENGHHTVLPQLLE